MDKNALWVSEQRIKRTMDNLEKNNMEAYYVTSNKELIDKVRGLLQEEDTVAVGGSMTLFDSGIIDFLRQPVVLLGYGDSQKTNQQRHLARPRCSVINDAGLSRYGS